MSGGALCLCFPCVGPSTYLDLFFPHWNTYAHTHTHTQTQPGLDIRNISSSLLLDIRNSVSPPSRTSSRFHPWIAALSFRFDWTWLCIFTGWLEHTGVVWFHFISLLFSSCPLCKRLGVERWFWMALGLETAIPLNRQTHTHTHTHYLSQNKLNYISRAHIMLAIPAICLSERGGMAPHQHGSGIHPDILRARILSSWSCPIAYSLNLA